MEEKTGAVLVSLLIITLVFVSGCTDKTADSQSGETVKHSSYDLPINTRSFYIGVVPTPKTVPETTWDDITAAYKETGDISEVVMIWSGVGRVRLILSSYY